MGGFRNFLSSLTKIIYSALKFFRLNVSSFILLNYVKTKTINV
jgi:hypothetical protein